MVEILVPKPYSTPSHLTGMVKTQVEACLTLSAAELARAGHLRPGAKGHLRFRRKERGIAVLRFLVGEDFLHLAYVATAPATGVKISLNYPVAVVRTPAINGGERTFFLCPRCRKRVGKLYLPPGATHFWCRGCHHLTYRSQQKRTSIWQKVTLRVPALEEELATPHLGAKRRAKALSEIENLRAELERTLAREVRRLFPEGLLQTEGRPEKKAGEDEALTEPVAAPSVKRARGRPKTKRPYHRHQPLILPERRSAEEGFCVKCRDYRELTGPAPITFPNGRPALQGTCPVCQSKVARIITASEAAGWPGSPR